MHDILQSPQAHSTVLARLRTGGWIASVGGKCAPPWAIGLNTMVAAIHTPFVRNFAGSHRPCALLAEHLTDLQVWQIEMSCGYLAVGRTPRGTKPPRNPAPTYLYPAPERAVRRR